MRSLSLLALFALTPLSIAAEAKLTLTDGDRVVLLGNTLIEREQASGWWELALTMRHPGKKITFRNLGWSGDDVFGTARAGFGTPADGFKHLKDHVFDLKPTVLLIGYGNVEAFEGEPGKERFRKGLETLLNTLAPTKARVVLLSPLEQANLGKPLPNPTRQNANILLYAEVIRKVAAARKYDYCDISTLLQDAARANVATTQNGIHLTEAGYRRTVPALTKALGWSSPRPITLLPGKPYKVESLTEGQRIVTIKGVAEGTFTLYANDKAIHTAASSDWGRGVSLVLPAEAAQCEKLRKLIVDKNELYFHRWRPQNITYLFGFRRHEQGKNAREIPQFDPLIEAKEKKIQELSIPQLTLELRPAQK